MIVLKKTTKLHSSTLMVNSVLFYLFAKGKQKTDNIFEEKKTYFM
jgi:hypothetical protein